MKKEILIEIKGSQVIEDEKMEDVEIITVATLYDKSGTLYLRYQESALTGFEGSTTTLKIEGEEKVTMMRQNGANKSQLIIEKERRHQCNYFNGMGDMIIGITGGEIRNTIADPNGVLDFSYSLDLNGFVTSENRVLIKYHN